MLIGNSKANVDWLTLQSTWVWVDEVVEISKEICNLLQSNIFKVKLRKFSGMRDEMCATIDEIYLEIYRLKIDIPFLRVECKLKYCKIKFRFRFKSTLYENIYYTLVRTIFLSIKWYVQYAHVRIEIRKFYARIRWYILVCKKNLYFIIHWIFALYTRNMKASFTSMFRKTNQMQKHPLHWYLVALIEIDVKFM